MAGIGILVEPGTAINGVLLIIVKLPVNPGGEPESGILVAEGKTMKGVPPILLVVGLLGCGVGAGMVVGPTTRKGVLLIMVVGALDS